MEGLTVEAPKSARCLAFDCVECAVVSSNTYFSCAVECGADMESPSTECIDCSYTFQDS